MGIGAVNIAIGATTTDFEKALNAAAQTVGQFRDNYKKAFEGLAGSAEKPQYAFQAISRELAKTAAQMRNLAAVGNPIPVEMSRKYYALKSAVDSVNGAFRVSQAQTVNNSSSLTTLAAGYFSITTAIAGVKQALAVTSDLQRLDTALKAVSTSTADYENSQRLLIGTANRLGLSYQALAGSYKGIKAATNGTILQGKETEKIFLSVVRASAALQLSADDTKRALLALQQMISKGTVSAEELRGQLGEVLPGSFKLFAQAAGVSEQKLGDMLKQGEIAATDILPKFAQKLEDTFGAQAQANVNTMGGGFQRLTDQAGLLIAEFTNTTGITGFFAEITNGVADTLTAMRRAVNDRSWLAFFGALEPGEVGNRVRGASNRKTENENVVADFRLASPDMRVARMQVIADEYARITAELNKNDKARSSNFDDRETVSLRERKKQLIELTQALIKVNFELSKQPKGVTGPVVFDKDAYKRAEDRLTELQKKAAAFAKQGQKTPDSITNEMAGLKGKMNSFVTADFEKSKKRLDELKSTLEGYKFSKATPPKELTDEYNRLSASIETVNNAFKKAKSEKPVKLLDIDDVAVYQRRIDQIQKGLLNFTGTDKDGKTYNRNDEVIANLRQLIKEAKDLEGGKRLLFELPEKFDNNGLKTDNIEGSLVGNVRKLEASQSKRASDFNNAGAAMVVTGTELIAKNGYDFRIQAQQYELAVQEIKGAFNDKGVESALARFRTLLVDGLSLGDAKDRVLGSLRDLNAGVKSILEQGAADMLAGTAEWVGNMAMGTAQASDLPKMLLGTLGDTATQLGRLAIGIGVGMEAIKKSFQSLTGVGAIAAGLGLVALGAMFKSGAAKIGGQLGGGGAVPFADGGLVFGPTLGLIGEGIGTTKRNPEVIAPLDRLQSMIGGGRQVIIPNMTIRGSDLLVVFDRATKAKNDIGR